MFCNHGTPILFFNQCQALSIIDLHCMSFSLLIPSIRLDFCFWLARAHAEQTTPNMPQTTTPRFEKMVMSGSVKGSADWRASRRWAQPGGNLKGTDHPSTIDSSKKGAIGKGKDHTSTNGDIVSIDNHLIHHQSVPLTRLSSTNDEDESWESPDSSQNWCTSICPPETPMGETQHITMENHVIEDESVWSNDAVSSGYQGPLFLVLDNQDPSGTAAPIYNIARAEPPPGLGIPVVDWTDESVLDRWRGLRLGETAPPIQKLMASEWLDVVLDPREKYQRDIRTRDKQDSFLHNERGIIFIAVVI